MRLSCLLLTSDATLLEVMRTSFNAVSVDLELRTDAASAIELSARRHLDSFVIDCDDVPGARDVLANIRSGRSNKKSVIFVVVNATTTVNTAFKEGADFVLAKPVQNELLRGFLDTAVARMEREYRRYFRHKASVPIQLLGKTGGSFAGKIMNVSEGGLALSHFGPAAVEGVVTVQFGIPSTEPLTFQAKAEVVWKDAYAMGLRFLSIEPGCRSGFAAWLDSLETQQQFRESTPSSNVIGGERGQSQSN
jgi:ActR/RegA family two-component response regulator